MNYTVLNPSLAGEEKFKKDRTYLFTFRFNKDIDKINGQVLGGTFLKIEDELQHMGFKVVTKGHVKPDVLYIVAKYTKNSVTVLVCIASIIVAVATAYSLTILDDNVDEIAVSSESIVEDVGKSMKWVGLSILGLITGYIIFNFMK